MAIAAVGVIGVVLEVHGGMYNVQCVGAQP